MQGTVKALLPGLVGVAVFSLFINVLMLALPLYTLQVYDRVLSSQSGMTLLMLTVVAVGILLAGGALDAVRNRLLVRLGATFDRDVGPRAFLAHIRYSAIHGLRRRQEPMADVAVVRGQLASPSLGAVFDLPWMPILLGLLFVFHPVLGAVALTGAMIFAGLGMLGELLSRKAARRSASFANEGEAIVGFAERDADVVHTMGLYRHLLKLWQRSHVAALVAQISAADASGIMAAISRAFRQLLQVGVIGTGAYLAIHDAVSPGVIIASSIILGRALAPLEGVVGNWRNFVAGKAAYRRLEELLQEFPHDPANMTMPRPQGRLQADNVMVAVPGQQRPVLHGISFVLQPGEVLGILGRTASGKSTLARTLVGLVAPRAGHVRLDGTDVSRWSREDLGPHIGYMPENPCLLRGTIAQIIARYGDVAPELVVEAARRANVHTMIQNLPDGYDTDLESNECLLSSGQQQRIALAQALYGDPALVVLDEPNSNIDFEGDAALIDTVRNLKDRGTTTVIVSHRQSILGSVDKLLFLENGQVAAVGARDQVMAQISPNPRLGAENRINAA